MNTMNNTTCNNIEKPIRIYECENSINGILTAVFEAGVSGYGHDYIRIEPQIEGHSYNIRLFSEYIEVETSPKKAENVMKTVRERIGYQAYVYMMRAVASNFPDRADAVYQFVTYGFSMGGTVCTALQIPWVKRVFEMNRAVGNESHYYKEFLRFQEVQKEPALLFAIIEPRHEILPMITEHFADRFMGEWFIIYDKTHQEAAYHQADGDWEIHLLTEEEGKHMESFAEQEEVYVDLWKAFFNSIVIEERKNKNLQRNMLPLHYRKHMTEFLLQ